MTGEIKPFNAQETMDRVREMIQEKFAELVPEAEWKRLVNSEIAIFMATQVEQVVKQKCKELTEKLTKEQFELFLTASYNPETGQQQLNDAVKAILIEAVPDFFAGAVAQISDGVIQSIRNRTGYSPY